MRDLRLKRVYEEASAADGRRVLIDRLWPRGVARATAGIDYWARPIAVSDPLRRWYGHDPGKFEEFRRRYLEELGANVDGVAELIGELGDGVATLVYAARQEHLSNAVVLQEYLREME